MLKPRECDLKGEVYNVIESPTEAQLAMEIIRHKRGLYMHDYIKLILSMYQELNSLFGKL
jgi:hypothetical protein